MIDRLHRKKHQHHYSFVHLYIQEILLSSFFDTSYSGSHVSGSALPQSRQSECCTQVTTDLFDRWLLCDVVGITTTMRDDATSALSIFLLRSRSLRPWRSIETLKSHGLDSMTPNLTAEVLCPSAFDAMCCVIVQGAGISTDG